ncbi:MAG: hypothetical protein JW819_12350 [Candidatus Krumholzibacteriota bacterium]|nr:hypothetical protein [Candidatus Krumholzibacteriota bacterium]
MPRRAIRPTARLVLLAAAAAALSSPAAADGWDATRAADLRPRILTAEERVLFLAPAGLHRFLPESEAWTVTPAGEGPPAAPLTGMWLGEGGLWVTGGGVAVSDLRYDDWQAFGPGAGWPGARVNDVEADADYAYAGTDAGAARFDQFVLEWEPLAGPGGALLGPVADVAVGEERVWFALAGGVAEYRKESESVRVDSLLGTLRAPRVLALRQGTRHLWALTDAGLARYDKDLESWTSFRAGDELPDARVRQISLEGEDLALGTDAGLWIYAAEAGVWREHESHLGMPGRRVLAFLREPGRLWVATEQALALYEEEGARWVDFTAAVPLAPASVRELARSGGALLLLGEGAIVYGLEQGQDNPSLFAYRRRELAPAPAAAAGEGAWGWRLDEAGLALTGPAASRLLLKGGTTVFVEDEETGAPGLGGLAAESRVDLTLSGRLPGERSLSGFYDSTDPDDTDYQLGYRGARDDILRLVALGEIEQQPFNAELAPGTGLRGGRLRAELGPRTEQARRRRLTADVWAGERRTRPGRDVFRGGSKEVSGSLRDVDYARGAVFPLPAGWSPADLREAVLWRDDGDAATDDANTEHRAVAGRDGAWDRLAPVADYTLGPGGETLILAAPLADGEALAAARGGLEADLTDAWLANRYALGPEPVPGSLVVAIADSTGTTADAGGASYLQAFGLDADGDGRLDAGRFSPVSGLLAFPDDRPFPAEVYADSPASRYTIEFAYRATLSTFRLAHRELVPGSERIRVDRRLLCSGADYSIIPASGLFVFFEHVLLGEDTVVEVEYLYEVGDADSEDADAGPVTAAQLGLAPDDRLYLGLVAARWEDDAGEERVTGDLNARLEWRGEERLLRLTPELAWSDAPPGGTSGRAWGLGLQGRWRRAELAASHRDLGADYASFEDRRTLLGRLRGESRASARFGLSRHLQAELDWEREKSDGVPAGGTLAEAGAPAAGEGEESSLTATVRLLREGLPNLSLSRGRVLLDAPGARDEKAITRAELEVDPGQAGRSVPGLSRLWLRAFFQRSERELAGDAAAADDAAGRWTTDHAFLRLSGAAGNPLSWNLAFEDQRRFLTDTGRDLGRRQELDATLQSRPHGSVDAYLRWEARRELFWHPAGGGDGFDVERRGLATLLVYPGRWHPTLDRLSLRLDLGGHETEAGEPGQALPGAGSLWSPTDRVAERRRSRDGTVEGRLQILPRLRLVERWESESGLAAVEGLDRETESRRLESRLEISPPGGLVSLRLITRDAAEGGADTDERRFLGQWDHAWRGGLLSFLGLDAEREETRDRLAGTREESLRPQARLTLRRARWRLDASLGGSLGWTRRRDLAPGPDGPWSRTREQALTATLSVQPWRILSVRIQYVLERTRDLPGESGASWRTDQDLRLRVQVRA